MNVKKVASFLLCSSAFTQRNITSILLVAVFFATYILAGGKIDTKLPDFEVGGGLRPSNKANNALMGSEQKRSPEEILGLRDTKIEEDVNALKVRKGSFFTEEDREQAEQEEINKDGLVKGSSFSSRRDQRLLQKLDNKQRDSLDLIEERLKNK